jgi:Transposase DDE domain
MKDGRRFGRPPDPDQPPAIPEGRINVTDPDSRVVKGLRGFLQGYNAQAVTNEHQVVLAAEIETVGADFGHLEPRRGAGPADPHGPMLAATERELGAAGVNDTPEVLLADAGYWHGEQMQRITERGIQVLIPPDTSRRTATRRNWDGGRYDEMREVLASERGGELYRKRQPMIEPVFAQMKFNRGLDRFRRPGRGAVRAEWRLITATHNLLKLHRHALAAA